MKNGQSKVNLNFALSPASAGLSSDCLISLQVLSCCYALLCANKPKRTLLGLRQPCRRRPALLPTLQNRPMLPVQHRNLKPTNRRAAKREKCGGFAAKQPNRKDALPHVRTILPLKAINEKNQKLRDLLHIFQLIVKWLKILHRKPFKHEIVIK